MNAIINWFVILVVVVLQLDRLLVCYKVTDLMQNENADVYKHYKGPYSLIKKKRLVLNSIWFTKKDREKLSSECKKTFFTTTNRHYRLCFGRYSMDCFDCCH